MDEGSTDKERAVKKLIERVIQTYRIAAHNVNDAIGITDHRALGIELARTVAKVLLQELVIGAVNTRHIHTGA